MLIPYILKDETDLVIKYWDTGDFELTVPNYEIRFYGKEDVVVRFLDNNSSLTKTTIVFNGKINDAIKKFISFDENTFPDIPTNLIADPKHIRLMAVKLQSLNKFS